MTPAGHAAAAHVAWVELGRYAYLRGHYREVRELMDQAVAADPAAPPAYRARALYGSGRLAHLQCDYEPAVQRLDAALLKEQVGVPPAAETTALAERLAGRGAPGDGGPKAAR